MPITLPKLDPSSLQSRSFNAGEKRPDRKDRRPSSNPLLKRLVEICNRGVSKEVQKAKNKKKAKEIISYFSSVEPLSPFLRHNADTKIGRAHV